MGRRVRLLALGALLCCASCSSRDRPAPLGSGGVGGACSNEPKIGDCLNCCDAKYPHGLDPWLHALTACVCQPQYCAAECDGMVCMSPSNLNDDACTNCVSAQLGPGSECTTATENACSADAACVAARTCVDSCQ